MSRSLATTWAEFRRMGRLVGRHLRYGRASFRPVSSPAKTEALRTLFVVTNDLLQRSGVPYALAYGTLLGWFRNGRLLAHDLDVDFGAPVEGFSAVWAARRFLPEGFTMHDTSARHFGPKLYVSFRGWEADIYFFADDGREMHSLERSRNPGDVAPFPRDYFYPLQRAQMEGQPTQVPARPEALLTHVYRYLGEDGVRDPQTRYFVPRRPSGG